MRSGCLTLQRSGRPWRAVEHNIWPVSRVCGRDRAAFRQSTQRRRGCRFGVRAQCMPDCRDLFSCSIRGTEYSIVSHSRSAARSCGLRLKANQETFNPQKLSQPCARSAALFPLPRLLGCRPCSCSMRAPCSSGSTRGFLCPAPRSRPCWPIST